MIKILTRMLQGHTYFELLVCFFIGLHLIKDSYIKIKSPSGGYFNVTLNNFTELLNTEMSDYICQYYEDVMELKFS